MKNNEYNNLSLSMSNMLNALSHPARMQIMLHLAKYNGCQAGSISARLPLAKSTVSEHLNKLKEAGLITFTIEGTYTYYQIRDEGYKLLQRDFLNFIRIIEQRRAEPQKCCPLTTDKEKIVTDAL